MRRTTTYVVYVILSRYIVLEIKFNMAWVECISVANHNWSYEPRMRTVRLINKETAKRN